MPGELQMQRQGGQLGQAQTGRIDQDQARTPGPQCPVNENISLSDPS